MRSVHLLAFKKPLLAVHFAECCCPLFVCYLLVGGCSLLGGCNLKNLSSELSSLALAAAAAASATRFTLGCGRRCAAALAFPMLRSEAGIAAAAAMAALPDVLPDHAVSRRATQPVVGTKSRRRCDDLCRT